MSGVLVAGLTLCGAGPAAAQNTTQPVAAARDAARIDRNAESAVLFQQAIDLAPARRLELLRELADQLTYSARAAEAIPLYREVILYGSLSASDRRHARLGLSLALAWSGQHSWALSEYDRLLEENPADLDASRGRAEALVGAARDAAHHDRNAESAGLFEQAITQAPDRRLEWLREYADQLTYSERAGQAVSLYRAALASGRLGDADQRRARHGLALALSWDGQTEAAMAEYQALRAAYPTDMQARVGVARLLSWSNHHNLALSEYAAVLESDPDHIEAQRDRARVESWRGRQRTAQRHLERFLTRHPDDTQATILLAQTQEWMGRTDKAAHTLRTFLDRYPADSGAVQALEQFRARQQPDVRTEYRTSRQSDALAITRLSLGQTFRLPSVRTTVGATLDVDEYTPEGSESRISVRRPGGLVRHRWSDNAELTGNVFLERIVPADATDASTQLTYDAWLTLSASDDVQFYVGSKRTTFDNTRSLRQGITGTYASFATDIRTEEVVVAARTNWGGLSDGNRTIWGQAEIRRTLPTSPWMAIGGRFTTFGFAKSLGNGYFDPKAYYSGEATLKLSGRVDTRLQAAVDGSVGVEHARPGGYKPMVVARSHVRYYLEDRLDIEVRLEFFSTRQGSSGGFGRRTFSSALRFVW